jgi:hypothetical protein
MSQASKEANGTSGPRAVDVRAKRGMHVCLCMHVLCVWMCFGCCVYGIVAAVKERTYVCVCMNVWDTHRSPSTHICMCVYDCMTYSKQSRYARMYVYMCLWPPHHKESMHALCIYPRMTREQFHANKILLQCPWNMCTYHKQKHTHTCIRYPCMTLEQWHANKLWTRPYHKVSSKLCKYHKQTLHTHTQLPSTIHHRHQVTTRRRRTGLPKRETWTGRPCAPPQWYRRMWFQAGTPQMATWMVCSRIVRVGWWPVAGSSKVVLW